MGKYNRVILYYQLSWCKLATIKSLKEDISSINPSSERVFIILLSLAIFDQQNVLPDEMFKKQQNEILNFNQMKPQYSNLSLSCLYSAFFM